MLPEARHPATRGPAIPQNGRADGQGQPGAAHVDAAGDGEGPALSRRTFTLQEQVASPSPLVQRGIEVVLEETPESMDRYAAATEIAGRSGSTGGRFTTPLNPSSLMARCLSPPRAAGPADRDPTRAYEIREEVVNVALALVKPEGFDRETIGKGEIYTAEIIYPKGREHLLLALEDAKGLDPGTEAFTIVPTTSTPTPRRASWSLCWRNSSSDPRT